VKRGNPYAKPDAKTLEARAKGYPARSVFKLQEIDRRMRLFRPGQNVIDLGAAPGSWSLYASERVGPSGHVYAIDIKPIQQVFGANVEVLQGDALALDSAVLSAHAPYDVVMSDMAPNTSGSKFQDQARSTELFLRALEVAVAHGNAGSHFAAKIFMSGDYKAAELEVRKAYELVKTIRPEGTRQVSSEVFVVGMSKRAAPTWNQELQRS
jgi:23S rRNA (uridine2552-2'-O)-methyltransferase